MGDEKPQVIGPLNLCFILKKNGRHIEVDQSVAAELDSLATEFLDTEDTKKRKQARKRLQEKLLSICDGWTVLNGRRTFRDYPKSKEAEPDAGNGEGSASTIVEKFVYTVASHPWLGTVPSEGLEQWRDQLLGLVQSMSIQDREEACRRVPRLVWVELVKPSIRAKHLDNLQGTTIDKHDISDWYAIPIELQNPCKFCMDHEFTCSWAYGPDKSKRCRECILAGRNRCFPQDAHSDYQRASGLRSKKQPTMSDDSDYRGHICTDSAFIPVSITRQADKEILNAVDGATCGQKRSSSPSNNHGQYGAVGKRPRTDERDASSEETQKTLVMDADFQDSITVRMVRMENAIEETRTENKHLRSTNESLKAEIVDLKVGKETTSRTLQCLQADITHVESVVQALRKDNL
ncbi:hypothetical protein IW261DRAFT_1424107 [Armillaria novae-zelandiae]|uniref:Uncharacterized protein n=1 Tax=Armillaria novae-zelandiae TaxID=153914 RepID=A0AA39NW39_9AGAR|nr:hypothetical protein IW261DRAFT_1424107 [Armillaria novae-zelandiae]